MEIDADTYKRTMQIFKAFMPHAWKRRAEVQDDDGFGRFAYYTTADTAMKIISSKRIWMRDARCMNDWSEIQYGLALVETSFNRAGVLDRFKAALDACHPNTSKQVIERYQILRNHIATRSYITCFSEHGPLPRTNDDKTFSEDRYGRLSMWRAYGRRNAPGVAFVLKVPMNRPLAALWVFNSPVGYLDQARFDLEVDGAISSLEAHRDAVRNEPPDWAVNYGYLMLALAAVSTKHQGFHEEREWRVVHFPTLFKSEVVLPSTETVEGVPQIVYKLPLENRPEYHLEGIDFTELLDKVIIGPTPYPDTIATALLDELTKAKVPDAAAKIVISNVPLRT